MLVIEGSSSVSGTVRKRSAGSAELSFMGLFVQNILYLFHAGSTAEGCLLLWEKEASQRREAFARWRILTVPPRSHPLHTLCFPFSPASVSFCCSGVWIAATQVSFGGSTPPITGNLRSSHFSTFINVSAPQPLWSTSRGRECQPSSSVTAFVNGSHLQMSTRQQTGWLSGGGGGG